MEATIMRDDLLHPQIPRQGRPRKGRVEKHQVSQEAKRGRKIWTKMFMAARNGGGRA